MIEAQELSMRYGSTLALDSATFVVEKGEIAGLLGPNGAGKSTTMKILTTFLTPTSGTARIAGHSIGDSPLAVRRLTGYLPENLPLYMDMEAAEYLEFVARARGLSGKALRERIGWVTERCGLARVFRTPVCFLSKGYKQRVGIAQALIHNPEIVILDEPTSGLDPRQIQDIRSLIRDLSREKTIILSTHILQEAEAMADKIIVINRGKIAGQGTREELRRQTGLYGRARFAVGVPRSASENLIRELQGVKECRLEKDSPDDSHFTLFGDSEGEMLKGAGKLAKDRGWQVLELSPVAFTLEESFLELTRSADGQPSSKPQSA